MSPRELSTQVHAANSRGSAAVDSHTARTNASGKSAEAGAAGAVPSEKKAEGTLGGTATQRTSMGSAGMSTERRTAAAPRMPACAKERASRPPCRPFASGFTPSPYQITVGAEPAIGADGCRYSRSCAPERLAARGKVSWSNVAARKGPPDGVAN